MRRVLVDTGALVALVRERDTYHSRVVNFLGDFRSGELLTTIPVLTETLHLLPARFGSAVLGLVRPPQWHVLDVAEGLPRISELLAKYADRPMDFADATLVYVAGREGIADILTIDHDDFETYRFGRNRRFRISPAR